MNANTGRWLVLFFVLAVAIAGIYYEYQNTRACVHPISYAIGAVDVRFGISNSALVNDAEAAANIWNKAEGKAILVYDPSAALKINLEYDTREATAKLGSEIATEEADANNARAALDALRAQYSSEQTSYNQEVDAINARGGATKSEAMALEAERQSLNILAATINQNVANYNLSVAALNTTVATYNQDAGHSFEEGEFVRDSAGERIYIYEFIGDKQLERVLAHEFGHAIGLGHNSNPSSIMYAQNESGNLVPTADDLSALKAVCNY